MLLCLLRNNNHVFFTAATLHVSPAALQDQGIYQDLVFLSQVLDKCVVQEYLVESFERKDQVIPVMVYILGQK